MSKLVPHALQMSPFGIAHWPFLIQPDTKFETGGVYKVDLEIEKNDETDRLHASLKQLAESAGPSGIRVNNLPMKLNERGDAYILKVSLKAVVNNPQRGVSFTQEPRIFDGALKAWDKGVEIPAGSEIRVAFQPVQYHIGSAKGVQLRLKDVQVKSLATEDTTPTIFDAVWEEGQTAQTVTKAQLTEDATTLTPVDYDEFDDI